MDRTDNIINAIEGVAIAVLFAFWMVLCCKMIANEKQNAPEPQPATEEVNNTQEFSI